MLFPCFKRNMKNKYEFFSFLGLLSKDSPEKFHEIHMKTSMLELRVIFQNSFLERTIV